MFPVVLVPTVNVAEGSTNEERFEFFHSKNQHIYEYLKIISSDLEALKLGTCSISMVIERLKWIGYLQNVKIHINNSYKALYARKLMQEPGLEGFFHTRGEAPKKYNGEPLPFGGADNDADRRTGLD